MKKAVILYFENKEQQKETLGGVHSEHECYVLKTFIDGEDMGIVAVYPMIDDRIHYSALTKIIELQRLGYQLEV